MILLEILDTALAPEQFANPADDQAAPTLSSVRKSRLTLMQINKLRMMNDVRRFEEKERLGRIKDQYSSPADESPM